MDSQVDDTFTRTQTYYVCVKRYVHIIDTNYTGVSNKVNIIKIHRYAVYKMKPKVPMYRNIWNIFLLYPWWMARYTVQLNEIFFLLLLSFFCSYIRIFHEAFFCKTHSDYN